jgi:starvation-inducible DNA-binding protein
VPAETGEIEALQRQLDQLNDLALTLKHAHWNVTGPHFIAIHTMIDPQVSAVREMADALAERIATVGGSPDGRASGVVQRRTYGEYPLGRADALLHLSALQEVYARVVGDHRAAARQCESDLVTHDLLTTQSADLEKFHWLVSAHGQSTRA